MKFMDPSEVKCPACGLRQEKAVADLLSLRAVCNRCGASLAEIGQGMKKTCEEVGNQCAHIVALIDLEEQLRIPIPDDFGGDGIKTKADFVRAVVSYLAKVAPEKADPELIALAYDQSLIRAGFALPASDETPLF
jgi:hypothetical protein